MYQPESQEKVQLNEFNGSRFNDGTIPSDGGRDKGTDKWVVRPAAISTARSPSWAWVTRWRRKDQCSRAWREQEP